MADTVAELIRARSEDDATALLFEDRSWTYAEFATECARRAAWIREARGRAERFHIGILADNIPDFPFWIGASALAGVTVVGINPTRRGAELARDIVHTDCSVIVTESAHRPLLDGLETGIDPSMVLEVDGETSSKMLAPFYGATVDEVDIGADPADLLLLIFTSGTSAAPKAVICSQGRLAFIGTIVAQMFSIARTDVCYQAMPMFHSNALMACWCPALASGSAVALRRKFSASGFLVDVRRFGATYFNYVGKTLSYVLATPEAPDDADNPLVRGFGNEGTRVDVEAFSRRFGCAITDGYGSTEGGAALSAGPDTPPGALGLAPEGTVVLDPDSRQECPRARFDEAGRLLNSGEATGELVNKFGSMGFEGYWNNEEASAVRLRDGMYWTGDLAYRDEAGYIYFAGRTDDWLRVDGENFASAPVERIIGRHPNITLAAVYAVPDPLAGDRVMAALQLKDGTSFDPLSFSAFLDRQEDLGTKWSPFFVRIAEVLPTTESNKIVKRTLRQERWECEDPVWWKPSKGEPYRLLTRDDIAMIAEELGSRRRY